MSSGFYSGFGHVPTLVLMSNHCFAKIKDWHLILKMSLNWCKTNISKIHILVHFGTYYNSIGRCNDYLRTYPKSDYLFWKTNLYIFIFVAHSKLITIVLFWSVNNWHSKIQTDLCIAQGDKHSLILFFSLSQLSLSLSRCVCACVSKGHKFKIFQDPACFNNQTHSFNNR